MPLPYKLNLTLETSASKYNFPGAAEKLVSKLEGLEESKDE